MQKSIAQLLTLAFLLTNLFACHKADDRRAKEMPTSVYSYVYAYTSGLISQSTPIRVRFTSSVATNEQIGQDAEDILAFSPSIKGRCFWESANTLRFEPEMDALTAGKTYLAKVDLTQLFDNLQKDAQEFEFDFRIKELNFKVNVEGFSAPNPNDLSKQVLTGMINTSDAAAFEKVEKILAAKQGNQDLEIEWEHENARTHRFVVQGVKRSDDRGELFLSWNGSPLNINTSDQKTLEIPSLRDFKVMSAEVTQGSEQAIRLHFSDPLKKSQNLKGLVRIDNYSGNLRFTIEGNDILIYPSGRLTDTRLITVESGVKNIAGKKMPIQSEWSVVFTQQKPEVRLAGNGVILPNSEGLYFPFEAINLNAVVVEVFQIFDNNILQFLQNNDFNGNYQLQQVGRVVWQEEVDLRNLNANANTTEWTRYALDLGKIFQRDPEAIYQIRIGFRQSYTSYSCGGVENNATNELTVAAPSLAENQQYKSIMDGYYGIDGRYEGYSWRDREDPCKGAYYSSRNFVSRNVISSDLGIIAKRGKDQSLFVAVSNLLSTAAVGDATIEFYDYQQQLIKSVQTDSEGVTNTDLDREPFVIIARKGNDKGYLKMKGGNSLSLSRFDVAGARTQKGIKGFIYGDRGVWRPGDTLFLNFIVEDKASKLPQGHPIHFELQDARGQMIEKRTVFENEQGIFPMHTPTTKDAATGNWTARVKVGGATFTKIIKVETIKPNRLKVELDFGKESLTKADLPLKAKLQANWLHGAPAQNLATKVELQVRNAATKFDKFSEFKFKDPARKFNESEPIVIFDGQVNGDGKADFEVNIGGENAPGKLRASFKTRVFEKGGDFSTRTSSIEYSPYNSYAGILLPENKYGSQRLEVGKNGTISFASVDNDGNPLKNKQLSVAMHRITWRWWWDGDRDNLSNYSSANHIDALQETSVTTNAKGQAQWKTKVDKWGRYLVRVCDKESGHCAGQIFYAGYPWDDEENGSDPRAREAAAMLMFSSNKEKYKVGETVELSVPASELSRVLVTLETGTKVIQSFWRDAKKGENTFRFTATADMAPTVYAHVALIQPHGQVENDLPMRMYGVIPINVEDPNTILEPVVDMPKEIRPEETFTIKVNEKNKTDMAYTVAIVDDGLLDLTNFKTPNPHASFYAREALGVQTYDLYDQVLGAESSELNRILSIGGDDAENGAKKKESANRFKPVVMHLGPFFLRGGETAKHTITMPNYVGSVRTMVVAANESKAAYGNAEITTPVRKPLMVLATLPRVLGPTEELSLPVAVFAMDKKIKDVQITVEEMTGMVGMKDGGKQTLSFTKMGEKMANFTIKVGETVGIAKFKITAKGGGEIATQEIELDVRNPNPYVTNIDNKIVNANENWTTNFTPVGMPGTNTATLEVSNIPPINLGKRLDYLLRYPYGCLEQTTSSVFPQLYVGRLIELDAKQKAEVPDNIKVGIARLQRFQQAEGGFSYWPGEGHVNTWSNNYAGHFLLEAKELGYDIPSNMLERWTKYQRKLARSWEPITHPDYYYRSTDFTQAYRLYTLAIAGAAELGAMNRLREKDDLSEIARWRLAAAYAAAGKKEVAEDLMKSLSTNVTAYRELGNTFGSSLRDKAMILETLVLLDKRDKAAELVRTISEQLSDRRWLSTQETAYALLAIGKFVGENEVAKTFAFSYQLGNGQVVNAGSNSPVVTVDIPVSNTAQQALTFQNKSEGILYARVINSGQPVLGDQSAAENKLKVAVNYFDTDGKALDVSQVQQGTDFIAEVTVIHPGAAYARRYDELALDQIFPSGWEIMNTRMDDFENFNNTSKPEYQDIRDDRVYTFFDLHYAKSKTFRIQLNAAYQGRYYLPTISCSAMYDETINARQPGRWVEVLESGSL